MYSCPTNDIHSIYIDNELPLVYLKEYEEHIKTCSFCSKKLENLKKIHNFLKADKESIQLDSNYMEQSFSRLETKLKYKKHTFNLNNFNTSYLKFSAVAAAVLLAIVVPLTNTNKKNSEVYANIKPITRPNTAPLTNSTVVINGNINNNLMQQVSTRASNNIDLTNVEVFTPDFNDKVTFKIIVPDFTSTMQQPIEVQLAPKEFLYKIK